MKQLHNMTDQELYNVAEQHVKQYRGVSESTRLLEELLSRYSKLRIVVDELTK